MKKQALKPHEHIVRQAIRQKRLLFFSYDECWHMVEPHLLGVSPLGERLLRAYDLGGEEQWGRAGWRTFPLSKLTAVKLINTEFAVGIRRDDRRACPIGKGLAQVAHERPLPPTRRSPVQTPSIRRRSLMGTNRRRRGGRVGMSKEAMRRSPDGELAP